MNPTANPIKTTSTKNTMTEPAPPRRKAPRKRRYNITPIANFSDEKTRAGMESALKKVKRSLGKSHPLRIGGESVITGEWIISRNPSDPGIMIGKAARAHSSEADRAVEAASKAFESWKRVNFEERAEIIFKTAKIFRRRRYELNSLMINEAGKSWIEADADTAEAIDFLEFSGGVYKSNFGSRLGR